MRDERKKQCKHLIVGAMSVQCEKRGLSGMVVYCPDDCPDYEA